MLHPAPPVPCRMPLSAPAVHTLALRGASGATRTCSPTTMAAHPSLICRPPFARPPRALGPLQLLRTHRGQAARGYGSKSVESTYRKMSQREHILLRPESYVGSVELSTQPTWVYDKAAAKMVLREDASFVPGLYKIFDEILVNAADNKQRDPTGTTALRVTIDAEAGRFSIWNNGRGIPVQKHATEGVYVPELVFGQLLTGSNFDDSEAKVTGGRNGFGAKLANIFSRWFRVETVSASARLKYVQTWRNNMTEKSEPEVTVLGPEAGPLEDYTLVELEPDLAKFGMARLADTDLLAVLERRVFDVAGCNEGLAVELNGRRLPASFAEYVALYTTHSPEPALVARVNERWQVAVAVASEAGFAQVSFVNSIATVRGGTHVQHVADQIVRHLTERINRTTKDVAVQPYMVKNQLFLFVNCLIENPAFDSQTKETLTTKPSAWGSRCTLSNAFLKDIETKTPIIERIVNRIRAKQQADLLDKASAVAAASRGRQRLLGIPKLEDANEAGGPRAAECTLILTEGDSAKALAVAGLSELGRDLYGVFPLKGKLLNVRDAQPRQLMENAELNHLLAIVGLSYERKYETAEELATLRYGRVMLMTDQDPDGSHIKGLFINLVHHLWPALLERHAFLEEFVTPIVKATRAKDKHVLSFFTLTEYERWKAALGAEELARWRVKYYKGLGTSTAAEAKEYFRDLARHRICFRWRAGDGEQIAMAFSKNQADARKAWITNYNRAAFVDHSVKELTFSDFIHKELVLFSRYDTLRCIAHAVDGLKPGQRKVLYGSLRRNLTSEVKVAQLAGYVSEHAGYHHGEASLHSTIINMAQDFVGSNNLPLLVPAGQFGTRLDGGKDAASARYIFTHLAPYTRLLFDARDDDLLHYLDDDGFPIEPEHYVPLIPIVLVNGCEGLGVGWSTQIPCYNPLDIIDNIERKLDGRPMAAMQPYYEGFKGTVEALDDTHFATTGRIEKLSPTTLAITELPVKRWTNDYKEFLDSLAVSKGPRRALIKDYREYHTNDSVHFRVFLTEANMRRVEETGLLKAFRLTSTISTSNMHLFTAGGVMKKFRSPLEIIEEHFAVRLDYYARRKQALLARLRAELLRLSEQHRFNGMVVAGELRLINVRKDALLARLAEAEFAQIGSSYDYLLSTPLWSLTEERIARLAADRAKKQAELAELEGRDEASLWRADLQALREALARERRDREKRHKTDAHTGATAALEAADQLAAAAGDGKGRGKGKGKGKAAARKTATASDAESKV